MTTLALAETRFKQFLALTKPRVVSLIVFCAVIGMFLATPGLPPAGVVFFATRRHRARRRRGRGDQLPRRAEDRRADGAHARAAAAARRAHVAADARRSPASSAALGLVLLYRYVNPLTMWLTLATFVGYAVVYTVLLKPATPQNIVIGGASGAMPPVLGWAAVTGDVAPEALILFLIIFVVDAAALLVARALPRPGLREGRPADAAGHARRRATRSCRSCSTRCALVAVTLLPYAIRMSGVLYLVAALALGGVFLLYAVQLYRDYSDALARATFKYSIVYLAALFSALLDRPLLALMRAAGEGRGARWSPLALALAGCGPDGPQVQGVRRHRRGVRPRLRARPTTPASRARWPTSAARSS